MAYKAGKNEKVLDHAVKVVLPSMRDEMKSTYEEARHYLSGAPGMGIALVKNPEPTLENIQNMKRDRLQLMYTGSGYMPECGMMPPEYELGQLDEQHAKERRSYKDCIAGDPKLYAEAEAAYKESLKSKGLRGERDPAKRNRGE